MGPTNVRGRPPIPLTRNLTSRPKQSELFPPRSGTPSDLAKFAIEIALSKQGKSNRVLTQTITREMLRPQMPRVEEIALGNEQHRDRMGLGFFLGDETRPDLFGHIGDDEGFQAMLIMFGDSGQGAAIMANSEYGIMLGDFVCEEIAKEYGWKGYVPSDRPHAQQLT